MLNLPRWRVILVLLVSVLGLAFAAPNLLPSAVRDNMPTWYIKPRWRDTFACASPVMAMMVFTLRSSLQIECRIFNLAGSDRTLK